MAKIKKQFVIQMIEQKTGMWADIQHPTMANTAAAIAWLRAQAVGDEGKSKISAGIYRVAQVTHPVTLAVQTFNKAIIQEA